MEKLERKMRLAEFSTLRDEMLKNKQYIFERPLFIITAAGFASFQLSGQISMILLPIILILILLLNLWFTSNRLRSNARISAYIEVVLESKEKATWVGWESSLRLQRKWMKNHSKKDREKILSKYIEKDAIPDAMMFYPPIYYLHLAMVILSIIVSSYQLCSSFDLLRISAFVITILLSIIYGYYCFGEYHPKKMKVLIEYHRAIWMEIFYSVVCPTSGSTGLAESA